jgi:hypothetical protein
LVRWRPEPPELEPERELEPELDPDRDLEPDFAPLDLERDLVEPDLLDAELDLDRERELELDDDDFARPLARRPL